MFWIFSENFSSKMVKNLLVNMVKRVGLWVFLLVITLLQLISETNCCRCISDTWVFLFVL